MFSTVRWPLAVTLLAVLLGPLAGAASAAQRWVAPTKQGAGDCSSQANAGTIEEGFGTCGGVAAKEGDEIVVTPGKYATKAVLTAPAGGKVHGLAGSARPTIASTGATTLKALTAEVDDLAIVNEASKGIALETGGVAENVLATATGPSGSAIFNSVNATIRDSVAITSGANGVALNVGTALGMTAVNVTAFSSGPGSVGVQAETFGIELPPTCISGGGGLKALNVIAHGVATDVATVFSGTCLLFTALVTFEHSNFHTTAENPLGTIRDLAANQRTAAQTEPGAIFVNPAAGTPDLHERAGAPTIDAGLASMLGPSDPDGNPRTVGAAPDIGAFEFVPPPVPPATPPATTMATTTPTTANTPSPVGQASAAGARASGATVLQTLACAGQPSLACHLAIKLTTLERLSGKRLLGVSASAHPKLRKLRVTVGTLALTLQAGQVLGAVVHLNATGTRLLKRLLRLPVTVATTTTNASGATVALASSKLTLRVPAHRRRH
jgi:hypothetical protein